MSGTWNVTSRDTGEGAWVSVLGWEILTSINSLSICGCMVWTLRWGEELSWRHLTEALVQILNSQFEVKTELSVKAKISIYCLSYAPVFTYGHKLDLKIERTRSQIQAAEINFPCQSFLFCESRHFFLSRANITALKNMIVSLHDTWRWVLRHKWCGHLQVEGHCNSNPHPLLLY